MNEQDKEREKIRALDRAKDTVRALQGRPSNNRIHLDLVVPTTGTQAEITALAEARCELANNMLMRLCKPQHMPMNGGFFYNEGRASYFFGNMGNYSALDQVGMWLNLDYVGRPLDVSELPHWSVLLQRPDYISPDGETYYTIVQAANAAAAIDAARAEAGAADECDEPDDYAVLLCLAGAHADMCHLDEREG